jgi:hypothetical protein
MRDRRKCAQMVRVLTVYLPLTRTDSSPKRPREFRALHDYVRPLSRLRLGVLQA